MTIRLYTRSDKEALIELLKLNIPKYFSEFEIAEFSDYLENHLERYFVIEEEGQVVGCGGINYFPEGSGATLSWDVIHPEYQGKGLGRHLGEYRIAEIRKDPGVRVIRVRTTQLTDTFYAKLGFELEKVEKDFWAPGFDLYQMKMVIGQKD